MDLIGYVDVARRRWLLLAGGALIAFVVVWATLPTQGVAPTSTTTYQATTTLVATPTSDSSLSLPTIALYATLGEVPGRAATRLGFAEDPQLLAATVVTAVDPATSTLTITSTDTDGPLAARRANVFAQELVSHFEDKVRKQAEAGLKALNATLTRHASRIEELDRATAERPDDSTLVARRAGLQGHYQALVAQASVLQDDLARASSPVEVLQPAVPVPAASQSVAPPSEPWQRIAIGVGLGLALGFALALVVERLDSRLRSREEIESALDLPVLAEVPARPWHQRREPTIASATDPGGATAESYRALRASLLLLRPSPQHGDEPVPDAKAGHPAVILVTSSRPAEGKTSTVANLAVVMAESGRSVLVLSLDFRSPRVHEYLDTPEGAGLSDLLAAGCPQDLERVVRETAFPGVRLATSGQERGHPGALLAGAGELIGHARDLADVVLIDTPPMLSVSDAVDLSPHVDAVLVVTQVNRTTTGQARAAQRLLSRLGVPALGAVLVGGRDKGPHEGYASSTSLAQQLAGRLGVRTPDRRDERHQRRQDSVGTPPSRRDDDV